MNSPKPRIMLIDDDPLFRGMVASLMSKAYQIETADNGSDGFDLALQNPPDIVVVDIHIPGWDGLTTLKAFRSHPELYQVKFVMLTADASRNSVFDAVSAGADDYLIKTGFTKQKFFKTIENLLNKPIDRDRFVDAERMSHGADSRNSRDGESELDEDPHAPVVPDATSRNARGNFRDLESELQKLIDSWD